MRIRLFIPSLLAAAFLFPACNQQQGSGSSGEATGDSTAAAPAIREESVTYKVDTATSIGFIAYDSSKADKRPVVLIVPEWWGLNDYVKRRARQLAELGYLAVAADFYGQGRVGATPDEAMKLAMPFYKEPQLAVANLEAALAKAATYAQADTAKTAAIGYCFGGAMVLSAARLGMPLTGVVSFHGGLAEVAPVKGPVKARVLVCNGAADTFVKPEDIAAFKKQMDSAGVQYTFKDYPGALHAFTNPDATETGKKFNLKIAYNEEADKQSWSDMRAFFRDIFGQ
jgi:dienelactone hydrolase/predicted small secreted protein